MSTGDTRLEIARPFHRHCRLFQAAP